MKNFILTYIIVLTVHVFAAGAVSNVKARQRYPWNGKVDIDCTVTGDAGQSYDLKVAARDKIGGTNLTVRTVSVDGGSAVGNPVSVVPGVYRLVWDAEMDLPSYFRSEKISISVTVVDRAKKFMIVDLSNGTITYQSMAPEGGWNVDEYKGMKMAFVRIEPGTFTQYSIEGMPGREVTITKPYYMGILPVTHRQLRTLVGGTYSAGSWWTYTFNDDVSYFEKYYGDEWSHWYGMTYMAALVAAPYRGGTSVGTSYSNATEGLWPWKGRSVAAASPLGVLRSRTKNDKFDLPTEALLMKARNEVVWSGKCLCLDQWNPWLGNAAVVDPMGGETSSLYTWKGESIVTLGTCVTKDSRSHTMYTSSGARFCLYEAE